MTEKAITGYVEFSDGNKYDLVWNGANGRTVERIVVEGVEYATDKRIEELESLARDMHRSGVNHCMDQKCGMWDGYAGRLDALGIDAESEES